jgi:hypothetical protein
MPYLNTRNQMDNIAKYKFCVVLYIAKYELCVDVVPLLNMSSDTR